MLDPDVTIHPEFRTPMTPSSARTETRCPRCSAALVTIPGEQPWCPACAWGLDRLAPPANASRRRVRKLAKSHRAAFEINQQLAERFAGERPTRPERSSAKIVLTVASAVLVLVDLALIGGGVAMLIAGTFVMHVVGVFMILFGLELRPRYFRAPPAPKQLRRYEHPELFTIVDEVCSRLSAPKFSSIVVDDSFNAACGRYGLLQRPKLFIGLPLWGTLSDSARLALLGHEVGHLVNGDPTRGLLTQPAVTTFGRLARVLYPRRMVNRSSGMGMDWLINPLVFVVASPLYLGFARLHVAMNRIAARDHQRAEIYADALAVEVGGTDATCELMTVLVFLDTVRLAITRQASKGIADPAQWRAAACAALDDVAAQRDVRAQLTLRRQASLLATHPPSGMRLALVSGWPAHPGGMERAELLAAADERLVPDYRRVRESMAPRS